MVDALTIDTDFPSSVFSETALEVSVTVVAFLFAARSQDNQLGVSLIESEFGNRFSVAFPAGAKFCELFIHLVLVP